MDVICVQHRDGWCATRRKKYLRYADRVPTLCGCVVTFPFGIERRKPDCEECLRKMAELEAGDIAKAEGRDL